MRILLRFFVVLCLSFASGHSEAQESTVSVKMRGVDVVEVLQILAEKGGLNLAISPKVQGRVNLFVDDVSVREALNVLVETAGLAYVENDDILQVMSAQEYEQRFGKVFHDRMETRVFQLEHAQASTVQQAISQLKSTAGKVAVDGRTNSLVIVEQPEILTQMEAVLTELDVPLVMRSLQLRHTLVADIAEIARKLLSEKGNLEVDGDRNRVVIWDIASKANLIATLIRDYDKAPQTQTRVFELNFASAEDVSKQVEKELSEGVGAMYVDPVTRSVIVRDLPMKLDQIDVLVKAMDVRRRQVRIEAKIVQVALKDQYKFGIDWEVLTGKLNGLNIKSSLRTLGDGDGTRITSGVLGQDNYTLLMEMLEEVGKTNVLSTPRITVLDGAEAKILVGSTVPYKTIDTRESTGILTQFERVTTVDVGVKLSVTPKIGRDGFIQMAIRPEVSSVVSFVEDIPVVETSEAETEVLAQEGATIVLAGLIEDDVKETVKGLPLLVKVPFLGKVFSSTDVNLSKSELVFFLTPRIVTGEMEVVEDSTSTFDITIPSEKQEAEK